MVQAVRIQKDLEGLNEFNATPGQGTTRLSYSPEAAKARPFIKEIMTKAGLTVREDALGNIFGRLSTSENAAAWRRNSWPPCCSLSDICCCFSSAAGSE